MMNDYNLPYETLGDFIVSILYSEIKGEPVDIVYEACYEELCLLDIPKIGLHFVVLFREEITDEVLDIGNPNPKEFTLSDFLNAKQKGVNSIQDIGFNIKTWSEEYGDFYFKNHCVM
jgi:hypothetical protein